MSLREIDRLVAERVMGWIYNARFDVFEPSNVAPHGSPRIVEDFRPSEHLAAAWEVWTKLRESGDYCCMDIRWPIAEGFEVVLRRLNDDHDKPFVLVSQVESAPLAICLAALKAVDAPRTWWPGRSG